MSAWLGLKEFFDLFVGGITHIDHKLADALVDSLLFGVDFVDLFCGHDTGIDSKHAKS